MHVHRHNKCGNLRAARCVWIGNKYSESIVILLFYFSKVFHKNMVNSTTTDPKIRTPNLKENSAHFH